jgi:alpha-ribazole phosphatase
MKTVLLIRHGETAARKGAFCGSTDVPLSKVGMEQSQKIVDGLTNHSIQLVITTGLQRTDFCGDLATENGIRWIVDKDFREVNFGSWEGMTWRAIEATDPAPARAWLDHPETMKFPNGENIAQFQKRIQRAWGRLTIKPEERIAIVGHSGVLSYLLHYVGKRQGPVYVQHGEVIGLHI